MTNRSGLECAAVTWMIGLLAGIVAAAMLMLLGGWTFMQGAFVGLVVFLLLGGLLNWTLCGSLVPAGAARAGLMPGASPPSAPAPERAPQPVADPPAPTPAPAAPAVADRAPLPEPAPVAPHAQEKPQTLSAAREGRADDLKRIRGVGPKLEAMLHRMGFFHYDQIAAWTPAEVAWVDEHLEGFKGRVSRDNWVPQAKVLAAGGGTDFSKRADGGELI